VARQASRVALTGSVKSAESVFFPAGKSPRARIRRPGDFPSAAVARKEGRKEGRSANQVYAADGRRRDPLGR
jgi:hypothetical protein